MVKTREDYRFSLIASGQRYKIFGHAICEDETLQLYFSSRLRPRSLYCGKFGHGKAGLTPVFEVQNADLRDAKALHYHPSGRVNLKRDGEMTPLSTFRALPFQLLKSPQFLCSITPATMGQLDLDTKAEKLGNAAVDIVQSA